ncbi:unnamed protein product, partial [Ceratitis capitata]
FETLNNAAQIKLNWQRVTRRHSANTTWLSVKIEVKDTHKLSDSVSRDVTQTANKLKLAKMQSQR